MPLSFLPKVLFGSLTQIPPAYLCQRQIRLLMLDFDNTVLPYTSRTPTQALLDWIEAMKQGGVTLCVVSNSKKDKAPGFCRAWGIDCVTRAKKPSPGGIRRCLAQYGLRPEQAALVGDQIFTDVLGANCAGVTSILVKPIHLSNVWLKLRHAAEQPFIFLARKRSVTK